MTTDIATSIYKQRLNDLYMKDPRTGVSDFYWTFQLDEIYSRQMVSQIINNVRAPQDRNFVILLDNALNIYESHVRDFRPIFAHEKGEKSILQNTLISVQQNYPEFDYVERFGLLTHYPQVPYQRMIRDAKPNAAGADAFDAMTKGLLAIRPRNKDDVFANMVDYRKIDQLLMRVQLNNGLDPVTIAQVADKTGLDQLDLERLERVCHSQERYTDTYVALRRAVRPLAIELGTKNSRG